VVNSGIARRLGTRCARPRRATGQLTRGLGGGGVGALGDGGLVAGRPPRGAPGHTGGQAGRGLQLGLLGFVVESRFGEPAHGWGRVIDYECEVNRLLLHITVTVIYLVAPILKFRNRYLEFFFLFLIKTSTI
jgi:hypothetical protein